MGDLKRHAHYDRDHSTGQYRKTAKCDACGKPVGTNYYTDDEVCGGSDGPGFYLCDRKRCMSKRDLPTVEARRALYTAQREANEAADRPRPKHSCEVERTVKVTHSTLNMGTGAITKGHSEVVTKACDTPLFGSKNEDVVFGVCRSCRSGWTHPDNFPTEKGEALIAQSLAWSPLPSETAA